MRGMVAEVWSENDRSRVFLNASRLALKDGQLSNGEKRILVKLAHALSLEDVSRRGSMMQFCLASGNRLQGKR